MNAWRAVADVCVALALVLICGACGGDPSGADGPVSSIPDKTVVLTFDDGCESQLSVVAPLLVRKGFRATFFATGAYVASEDFLDWEGIAEIHRMGLEIGNHSFGHHDFSDRRVAALLEADVRRVEAALAEVGVPKPVTFAWPANAFGPEARATLERMGYSLARRGMAPEHPERTAQIGLAWDPSRQEHLLIPSAYVAHPDWTLEHFAKVVDRARGGRPVVLQFHDVTGDRGIGYSVGPERFREFMDYLDREGCHVVALGDLLPYLEGTAAVGDRMRFVRYP